MPPRPFILCPPSSFFFSLWNAAGEDYTAFMGTLQFTDSTRIMCIPLNILPDPGNTEDEAFIVVLNTSDAYVTFQNQQAVVTIETNGEQRNPFPYLQSNSVLGTVGSHKNALKNLVHYLFSLCSHTVLPVLIICSQCPVLWSPCSQVLPVRFISLVSRFSMFCLFSVSSVLWVLSVVCVPRVY